MPQSTGFNRVLSVFKRGQGNGSRTPGGKTSSPSKGATSQMESSPRKLFPAFGTPSKVATSGNIMRKPGGLAGRDTGLIPASRALQTTPPPAQGDAAIQVIVRVRPRNNREANLGGATCLQSSEAANTIRIVPPAEPHAFAFDHVASETASQSKIYELAGRPIVANCLKGMNGCLMAYGQTGSGKTYTMQGPDDGTMQMQSTLNQQGGLIQRVFEHLFEAANADSDLQTTVSCSFLEIYNETICDLLAPSFSTGGLALREDAKRGVFVEGLSEEKVNGIQDVRVLLQRGVANRRVGETQMNERSSRSHSVFTASIERRRAGTASVLRSRLHLVDLAGSERQKSSAAAGERLREASAINKSLSALGLVIASLVDQQQGRHRHVPYRDSKLTFLLQDSLGGNAKTILIATVSPSALNAAETLSTLRFADSAKRIKNTVTINEDTEGDAEALRLEVQRLRYALQTMQNQAATGEVAAQSPVAPRTAGGVVSGEGARRALVGALRREDAAVARAEAVSAELEGMKELIAAKDSALHRTQMMLKLKESRLACGAALDESGLVASLRQEIEVLKSHIDSHPDVKRFAVENLHLSQELARLQAAVDGNELEALQRDVAALRAEMLGMAEAIEAAQEEQAMARAEADAAITSRSAAEKRLQGAQLALQASTVVDANKVEQRLLALRGQNDELQLKLAKFDETQAECERLCSYAAGLEAECEHLRASLSDKAAIESECCSVKKELQAALEAKSALEAGIEEMKAALRTIQAETAAQADDHHAAVSARDDKIKCGLQAVQIAQDELERCKADALEMEKTIALLHEDRDGLKADLATAETKLKDATVHAAELEARCQAADATVAGLKTDLDKMDTEKCSLKVELSNAKADLEATHGALEDSRQRHQEEQRKVSLAEEAAEGARARIAALETEVKVTAEKSAQLEQELESKRLEADISTAHASQLNADLTTLKAELAECRGALKTTDIEHSRLREALAEAMSRGAELQEQLENAENARTEAEYELSDKSASLSEALTRLISLQNKFKTVQAAEEAAKKRAEAALRTGTVAERERAALALRVAQLEESLAESRAQASAGRTGPLEREQQLLLAKAEVTDVKKELAAAHERVRALSATVKAKDEELRRVQGQMDVEVRDAAQQVQELLAAQARAEAAEARAAELATKVHVSSSVMRA